jgi:hypothetical protein
MFYIAFISTYLVAIEKADGHLVFVINFILKNKPFPNRAMVENI